jgi:transposase
MLPRSGLISPSLCSGFTASTPPAVVVRKKLRRVQVLTFFETITPCLIGMEACATAHFWARELAKFGHEVRLMPPSYVKAYLRRQKNDAADAEAICEAVTRPTMRFVAVKSAERQSVLALHRTRELLVRQRTMLINAIRGHCAEFGIIAPQGLAGRANSSNRYARPIKRRFRTWRDPLCRC